MAKINIKIEDLFERLSLNDMPTREKPEISFDAPEIIKVKTPQGNYEPIKKFIKKLVDSYKVWFNNGLELICSDSHILLTDKGEKKIKEINTEDNVIIYSEYGERENLKIENYSLYKKDDILYDISIDHPHLFIDTNGLIHHNSLIISYIMKILLDRGEIEKGLVIVPTINLVEQFYNDMWEYGIGEYYSVGKINKDNKDFDCPVTISTWQSLKNRKNILHEYQCVITDECHQNSAREISNILSNSPAHYRMGCTGTMPGSMLDYLQVISYIGPVLAKYKSQELAKQGYISTCKVNTIKVKHPHTYVGEYSQIKDQVVQNKSRIDLIKRMIENVNDSILLLVNKVENEGDYIKEELEKYEEMQDKEIVFVSGRMKPADREYWRKRMNESNNVILIATYQVFSVGINIPTLKYVIFASPLKSKIKVLQSIGRSLRKHSSKEGALIYDLIDQVKYLKKHGNSRMRHYMSENFEIEESEIRL